MILPSGVNKIIGGIISLIGFGINLWTLSALGVKGIIILYLNVSNSIFFFFIYINITIHILIKNNDMY